MGSPSARPSSVGEMEEETATDAAEARRGNFLKESSEGRGRECDLLPACERPSVSPAWMRRRGKAGGRACEEERVRGEPLPASCVECLLAVPKGRRERGGELLPPNA